MPLQTTFGNKVTDVSATRQHPAFTLRIEGDKIYRYVQASNAVDKDDGVWITGNGTVDDAPVDTSMARAVLGVVPVAIASGHFGWVQCSGPLAVATLAGTFGAPVHANASTGALGTTAGTAFSQQLGIVMSNNNIYISCM